MPTPSIIPSATAAPTEVLDLSGPHINPCSKDGGTSSMSSYYSGLAATLRDIADDLDGLGLGEPWFSIDIQPGGASDGEKTAAVDAVGTALLGRPGETHLLSGGGGYHHRVRGARDGVRIGVYDSVSDPAERELRAELERLRAEVAAHASRPGVA